MKNVHLIPTDKPSRLILQGTELVLSKYMEVNEGFTEFNQHIYITSDEEIKKGDWYLEHTQVRPNRYSVYKRDYDEEDEPENSKKIVITTDPELIKDGIQAIDDEFLTYLIKNPTCELVGVEETWFSKTNDLQNTIRKIIYLKSPDFSDSLDKTVTTISIANSMFGPDTPEEETLEISEEAKQRAKNHMALKGALDVKKDFETLQIQAIYDKHKQKLNNLKENRARSEEENWSDSEIKSVDDQITILASILSDLYWNVINPTTNER